ncbi:MAG: hypothetical protein FWH18_10950 [Marinilabiliaceae bacterium]|nr:hypothetical protein [Marinilabiliaceae bacterium]
MSVLSLFNGHFSGEAFEEQSRDNGYTYWYASRLMSLLGYESMISFSKAINKAMTTCNTLTIPILDNFEQILSTVDGKTITDFKLSRFACYLIAMNADNRKPEVAQAQAYFAALAGAVTNYLEEANNVERIIIRNEITDRENSLSGVAKKAGIESYAYFQSAGYRGMYNMNITKLREIRDIPDKRSPLDFMGKEELAANLFRITQTELKIKNENIKGQSCLEITAENAGKEVRGTMMRISKVAPENLPKSSDIVIVKKDLKSKSKKIKQIDSKKNTKK